MNVFMQECRRALASIDDGYSFEHRLTTDQLRQLCTEIRDVLASAEAQIRSNEEFEQSPRFRARRRA